MVWFWFFASFLFFSFSVPCLDVLLPAEQPTAGYSSLCFNLAALLLYRLFQLGGLLLLPTDCACPEAYFLLAVFLLRELGLAELVFGEIGLRKGERPCFLSFWLMIDEEDGQQGLVDADGRAVYCCPVANAGGCCFFVCSSWFLFYPLLVLVSFLLPSHRGIALPPPFGCW